MSKSKRDFTNPAMSFITIPVEETESATVQKVVQNNRTICTEDTTVQKVVQNNRAICTEDTTVLRHHEAKTERLELRIRPTTLEHIKSAAATHKMSVNEAVHQVLDAFFVNGGTL